MNLTWRRRLRFSCFMVVMVCGGCQSAPTAGQLALCDFRLSFSEAVHDYTSEKQRLVLEIERTKTLDTPLAQMLALQSLNAEVTANQQQGDRLYKLGRDFLRDYRGAKNSWALQNVESAVSRLRLLYADHGLP